jgi:hypothetical protein
VLWSLHILKLVCCCVDPLSGRIFYRRHIPMDSLGQQFNPDSSGEHDGSPALPLHLNLTESLKSLRLLIEENGSHSVCLSLLCVGALALGLAGRCWPILSCVQSILCGSSWRRWGAGVLALPHLDSVLGSVTYQTNRTSCIF